jgi:hypothetical protein
MKRIISLLLVVILVSGCGRLQSGGNAENFDDISGVVKHTPLSSDPANLPAPTTSPIPNPTAHAKPVDELCVSRKDVDVALYCDYGVYAGLSALLNVVFLIMAEGSFCRIKLFTILKMVSAFSFPVYAYLTNPSFLSKSKLSLTALAVDTCLSLYSLINPSVNSCIGIIQGILELFRVLAYPMLSVICSHDFHDIKGAI